MKNLMLFSFSLCIFTSLNAFHFYQTESTLRELSQVIMRQEKGVYLRFGDGDLIVMEGENDSHQPFSSQLQCELRAAMAYQGVNVFKCLPLYHSAYGGFEEGMNKTFGINNDNSVLEFSNKMFVIAKKYCPELDQVYSHAALLFAALQRPALALQFLLFLKQSHPILLVGNQYISDNLRRLLFGKQCAWVPTPEFDAYKSIDQIEAACDNILKDSAGFKLVIVSMGLSGRALEMRLYKKYDNIFLFDFGSLMDAFSEAWKVSPRTIKRAWVDISNFNHAQFLEAFQTLEATDKAYQENPFVTGNPVSITSRH